MPAYLDHSVAVAWMGDRFALARVDGTLAHDLSPAQALALLLLGDMGDPVTVRETAEALDPALAIGVDQVLTRFPTYLQGTSKRPIDPGWWGEMLRRAPARPRRSYAAPASVTWLLTLECNRRCPYCFYRILPVEAEEERWPRDALLREDAAARVIDEMARIGTADLYLTGGEPLLRPDLDTLVARAANAGIRVHLVTKFAISSQRAKALASARLHHITISLDDLKADVARRLTGADDYPSEALASIRACLKAGLAPEVNAVITRINAPGLPALAQRLESLGCKRFTMSPMEAPHFRTANVGALENAPNVDVLLTQVRSALAGNMVVDAGGATNGGRRPCGEALICEVGHRSLHILPNGDVTRCHYVPGRPELVIGSLLDQSILEIWTGDRFARWREPERAAFGTTACHDCGGFSACNQRGRCVASALLESGQSHAPDAFCVRV